MRTTSPILRRATEPAGRGAFTLIELMLVMALLVIVIAVSAPSLKGFFHGRTLDSEARRFVSLTRYGQSRAVSEGVPMLLWIDKEQRQYGLQMDPGYLQDEDDEKAVEYDLDKDVEVEPGSAPVPDLFGAAQATSRSSPEYQDLPTQAQTERERSKISTIRFKPDGFVDELSPETVLFTEGENGAIQIAQSRGRLHYEVNTNYQHNAR